MSALLMHICCAPDATIGYERLCEKADVTGFFYNPNIEPLREYELRESEARKLANLLNVNYIEGLPDRETWRELTAGLENEPERGERCRRCIAHSLEKTALKALELNIPTFATTLTTSPHKDVEFIHKTGKEIAERLGIEYLPETLRKNDGFKRSIELSKKYNLYRQNYCGCRWSKKESREQIKLAN